MTGYPTLLLMYVQAWRVCHPPRRGTWWLGRSPLVHRGFMQAWAANGLATRVVAAIKQAVADSGLPPSSMRILLTGAPAAHRPSPTTEFCAKHTTRVAMCTSLVFERVMWWPL